MDQIRPFRQLATNSVVFIYPEIMLLNFITQNIIVSYKCKETTRQAMYVWRNIEVRSRNPCCRVKAIGIIYSVCVCSPRYLVCNVCASCYIVICSLSDSSIFSPHYLINNKIFEKKKVIEQKMRVFIFSASVWNISHSKKNSVRFEHKCTSVSMYSTVCSCHIVMKLEFSRHSILIKI